MSVNATAIVETLENAGYGLFEKLDYAVEYSRRDTSGEKRVYIDFSENSISIDAYNPSDRLVSTEKIVVKHVSDLNRASRHIS